jgi:hypothetical protein
MGWDNAKSCRAGAEGFNFSGSVCIHTHLLRSAEPSAKGA